MMRNQVSAFSTGRRKSGTFIYSDYRFNHVIGPGRDAALKMFVEQSYGNLRNHKWKNAHSSHSEDALTWSCLDSLAQLRPEVRDQALAELWELAYDGSPLPPGVRGGEGIVLGRSYGDHERTEVDASIEGSGALVFLEAKLYSAMSPANPPLKPYNQIARKLRVGLHEALNSHRDFYFILLDLAPPRMLLEMNAGASLNAASTTKPRGFNGKWLTAYWYLRYKGGRGGSTTPLKEVLADIDRANPKQVAQNMGWLTWADVFKIVLRAMVTNAGRGVPPNS